MSLYASMHQTEQRITAFTMQYHAHIHLTEPYFINVDIVFLIKPKRKVMVSFISIGKVLNKSITLVCYIVYLHTFIHRIHIIIYVMKSSIQQYNIIVDVI